MLIKRLMLVVLLLKFYSVAAATNNEKIIMSYWAAPAINLEISAGQADFSYPLTGSLDSSGNVVDNKNLDNKLNLINVLAYAFLQVNKQGIVYFSNPQLDLASQDQFFCQQYPAICDNSLTSLSKGRGNFSAFAHLSNNTHSLKKLLAVGGAASDASFQSAISYPQNFVNSVASIINYYHVSGVDLDFEINGLYTLAEAKEYAQLVNRLRLSLGNRAIITMTVAPDNETMHSMTRQYWAFIADKVNFISVMCYDFHAPFYAPYYTGYNSNLFGDANEPNISNYYHISCDQAIKYLTFLGVPANKILLGFPSYGLAYGGVANSNSGLFQAFNPDLTPVFDGKGLGRVEYKTIISLLQTGFHEHESFYNNKISGVWAYNPVTKQFISYDNTALIKEKADYIKQQNLAGAMMWAINYDMPVTSQYSLLQVLVRNLQ